MEAYSNDKGMSIWLDLLPPEICCHIVASIDSIPNPHEKDSSKLYIAETSEKQRLAVLSSLNEYVYMPAVATESTLLRLGTLFGNALRVLKIAEVCPSHTAARFLIHCPFLTSIDILAGREYLVLLAHLKSVRDLRISTFGGLLTQKSDLQLFCFMLRALSLRSLTISCFCLQETCPTMEYIIHDYETKGPFLQELKAFEMLPQARKRCGGYASIFWLVHTLPNLRHINIPNIPVPEEHVEAIRQLDSVSMCLNRDPIPQVTVLGRSVTVFETRSLLRSSEVSDLNKCPNITSLSMRLVPGAESALLSMALDLQRLSLEWKSPGIPAWQDVDVHGFYNDMRYYRPDNGILFRIMKSMSSLRVLQLRKVRIEQTELRDILIAMGPKLEEFHTSIASQAETPQERVMMLMETVAKYNPSVRELHLHEAAVAQNLPMEQMEILGEKLEASFRHLRLKVPLLCMFPLWEYLKSERRKRELKKSAAAPRRKNAKYGCNFAY